MRERKFRAWDLNEKKILSCEYLSRNGMYVDPYSGTIMCYDKDEEQLHQINGLVIMQYTGLKDRNAKEIYEGDIINFEYSKQPRHGVVVFNGCMFGIDKYPLCNFDKIEIKGNIYENLGLAK